MIFWGLKVNYFLILVMVDGLESFLEKFSLGEPPRPLKSLKIHILDTDFLDKMAFLSLN